MKKILALSLALVLCFSILSGCAGNKEQTMTLFTWEGMFPPEVIEGFEKENNIKVNYVNFDFDETMLAKLEAAKGGEYDLVIADDYIIETVIAQGLAQKLNTSKIPNLSNVNPTYKGQFFDKTDEYTVPYGAGVLTIAYNPSATDVKINSYNDLWNSSLKNSIIAMMNLIYS